MSGVKLSGSLPNEFDRNGLDVLHSQLVAHPDRRHLIVMVVDTVRTTIEHGGEDERYTATIGALYVEPVRDPEDVKTVADVMARARAERTGDATLDFDFGMGSENPVVELLKHGRGMFVGDEGTAS